MKYFVIVLVLSFCLKAFAQGNTSFASLNLALAEGQVLPLNEKITFDLVSSRAEQVSKALGRWENISSELIDEETVRVTMIAQPTFSGEVLEQYSNSSFVIDTDEETTEKFLAGFDIGLGQSVVLEKLAGYVSSYIDEPNYIHGFNIASVVASQRSGDCTEYAVLTTALARSLQLPARVVIGTVIVEEESHVSAIGHAWTEVWHDEQWQILDAALYGSVSRRIFYLPASELDNEGPGYTMGLLRATNLMPKRIERLQSL
jgi:hypothetical protein